MPDFKKLLDPLIDEFVNGMQKLEKEKETYNKNLADEIKKLQQEQRNLRAKISENDHKLELAKDTVAHERVRQVNLNNQLKEEASRNIKLSKEYESKIEKTAQNLKDSIVEKEMVAEALSRAKKKETDYDTKIRFLRDDFAKSDSLRKELNEKEKNLNSRSKASDKQQHENVEQKSQLDYKELQLQAKQKEVCRLIEKHKLEKEINA